MDDIFTPPKSPRPRHAGLPIASAAPRPRLRLTVRPQSTDLPGSMLNSPSVSVNQRTPLQSSLPIRTARSSSGNEHRWLGDASSTNDTPCHSRRARRVESDCPIVPSAEIQHQRLVSHSSRSTTGDASDSRPSNSRTDLVRLCVVMKAEMEKRVQHIVATCDDEDMIESTLQIYDAGIERIKHDLEEGQFTPAEIDAILRGEGPFATSAVCRQTRRPSNSGMSSQCPLLQLLTVLVVSQCR